MRSLSVSVRPRTLHHGLRLTLLGAALLLLAGNAFAQSLVGNYRGTLTLSTTSDGLTVSKSQPAAAVIRTDPEDNTVWIFRAFTIVENLADQTSLLNRFVDSFIDKKTRVFADGEGSEHTLEIDSTGRVISFTLTSTDGAFRMKHRYVLRKQ